MTVAIRQRSAGRWVGADSAELTELQCASRTLPWLIKREVAERMIFLGEDHLRCAIKEYLTYYHCSVPATLAV